MQSLQVQSLCRNHLRLVNLALTQYASDNDGRLPALNSMPKLKKQISNYSISGHQISGGNLVCPITNQGYRANKNLAGKKLKEIAQPAKTLVLWSARPLADGHYMVLNADGQSRRVTAGELAKMKSFSKVQ